jgi:transcriptional regulator with XRE-family HTH domain
LRERALTFSGKRLKEARTTLGISRLTLSYKIQFSPQSIERWENDQSVPTSDAVARIASVFGKPMDWFFEMEKPDAKG